MARDPRTVLLLTDDADLPRFVSTCSGLQPAQLQVVSDAVAFAAVVAQPSWHAAVLVANRPWLPHLAALQTLRRVRPDGPLWLLCEAPSTAEVVAAMRAGATDCLPGDVVGLTCLVEQLRHWHADADVEATRPPTPVAGAEPAVATAVTLVADLTQPSSIAEETPYLRALRRQVDAETSAGRWHDAAATLRRLLADSPPGPHLRPDWKRLVSICIEHLHDPEAALQAWTAWRRTDRYNAELTRTLRDALVRVKKWPQLAELLQEMVAESPDRAARAELLVDLADVQAQHLRNPQAALQALEHALRESPGHLAAQAALTQLQVAEPSQPGARHLELVRPPDHESPAPDALRMAVHDLQEPLRSVDTWLNLLTQRLHEDAESRALVDKARASLGRMQHKVTATLRPADSAEVADTEAEMVMQSVLQDLSTPIREVGATVTCGPLPRVRLGRGDLATLLQNLVGNALKYRSDAPPQIRVQARIVGESCEFRISDNGIGISATDRRRVLQLFERGGNAAGREGLGIGLGACAHIVRRVGGNIWFDPAVSAGATVCFTVPAAKVA